jgi:hypothetical protein
MSEFKVRFRAAGKRSPEDGGDPGAGPKVRVPRPSPAPDDLASPVARGTPLSIPQQRAEAVVDSTPAPEVVTAPASTRPTPPVGVAAARPATADPGASGSAACPACGIQVKTGYVRCPKCKHAFDGSRAPIGGGTAVVGRTVPWAIVAVMALLTIVIVVLADREPSTRLLQGIEVQADGGPEDGDAPEGAEGEEADGEAGDEAGDEAAADGEGGEAAR